MEVIMTDQPNSPSVVTNDYSPIHKNNGNMFDFCVQQQKIMYYVDNFDYITQQYILGLNDQELNAMLKANKIVYTQTYNNVTYDLEYMNIYNDNYYDNLGSPLKQQAYIDALQDHPSFQSRVDEYKCMDLYNINFFDITPREKMAMFEATDKIDIQYAIVYIAGKEYEEIHQNLDVYMTNLTTYGQLVLTQANIFRLQKMQENKY
jgi:hypothetical protein